MKRSSLQNRVSKFTAKNSPRLKLGKLQHRYLMSLQLSQNNKARNVLLENATLKRYLVN
jgi:hypothetical protein